MTYLDTGLWADVRELPGALGETLTAGDGVAEAAELLRAGGVERIVATGNGAAYYVAHALWLASLESAAAGPPIVAVPCGIAVRDRFRWQPGDAVLAVSSSGEFRDVVEIARRAGGRPCVAITAQRGLLARRRGERDRAAARRLPARGDSHAGARRRVRRSGSRCGRRSPATPSWRGSSTAPPRRPRARSPRPRTWAAQPLPDAAPPAAGSSSAAAPRGPRRSSSRSCSRRSRASPPRASRRARARRRRCSASTAAT